MTILALGKLLASVIQTYMALPATRVILTDENYDAPKDSDIYVLIIYDGTAGVLGVNSAKNFTADTETMGASSHERFAVEVVSRNRTATERHKEVLFALQSISGTMAAESAGCAFFREGSVLDLSAIEGAGALRRYRIPVIITNVETKTSAVPMINKFTEPTINTEAK